MIGTDVPSPPWWDRSGPKQSLRCLAVEPRIGGVLLCGEKGTAKVMGGLEGVRLVELPVSATEDMLLGGVELEAAVRTGRRTFQPGLLAVPTGRCSMPTR